MSEFKDVLHHALSAMFGALILAAVVGLIALGNMIWNAFAEQNAANNRLKEYAKYSAFDGTTVRGQEVISLLHQTQGSPWIVIASEKASEGSTGLQPICVILNEIDVSYSFTPDVMPSDSTAKTLLATLSSNVNTKTIDGLAKAIKGVTSIDYQKSTHDASKYKTVFNFTSDISTPLYSELQEWFLLRGKLISEKSEAGYLPYESYLVYEDNYSTDICGIILIEVTD